MLRGISISGGKTKCLKRKSDICFSFCHMEHKKKYAKNVRIDHIQTSKVKVPQ
jgi:hypothetical protein